MLLLKKRFVRSPALLIFNKLPWFNSSQWDGLTSWRRGVVVASVKNRLKDAKDAEQQFVANGGTVSDVIQTAVLLRSIERAANAQTTNGRRSLVFMERYFSYLEVQHVDRARLLLREPLTIPLWCVFPKESTARVFCTVNFLPQNCLGCFSFRQKQDLFSWFNIVEDPVERALRSWRGSLAELERCAQQRGSVDQCVAVNSMVAWFCGGGKMCETASRTAV